MTYEFRVTDLAREFGVHRNTIRNWINAGILPATPAAGKRYRVNWDDYARLCARYGRTPRQPCRQEPDLEMLKAMTGGSTPASFVLDGGPVTTEQAVVDRCNGCGSCGAACPISGVDGLDPRKLLRLAALGMERDLLASDWPWKCTLCRRCELSCPMGIGIVDFIRRLRGKREAKHIPGSIRQGIKTCLEHGNNIGIPREDLLAVLAELEQRMIRRGLDRFSLPIDRHDARLLVLLNSKIIFTEPELLECWCTIFDAAKESWTLTSRNWEESNWGYLAGDDRAWKNLTGRIVDNLLRLGCQALLLPGCGHSATATLTGLKRWFPEILERITIYSPLDLLAEYLHAGRLVPDPLACPLPVIYHPPCHYSRSGNEDTIDRGVATAHTVLSACCPHLSGTTPEDDNGFCCGAGGGIMAGPFAAEQVLHGRLLARRIRESGARVVVTPCSTCRDQIRHVLNREFDLDVEVLFPWQLMALALAHNGEAMPPPAPHPVASDQPEPSETP